MNTDQFIYLLGLAIFSGALVGLLKAYVSRLRSKRKALAPMLGVVLPKNKDLASNQTSKLKDTP